MIPCLPIRDAQTHTAQVHTLSTCSPPWAPASISPNTLAPYLESSDGAGTPTLCLHTTTSPCTCQTLAPTSAWRDFGVSWQPESSVPFVHQTQCGLSLVQPSPLTPSPIFFTPGIWVSLLLGYFRNILGMLLPLSLCSLWSWCFEHSSPRHARGLFLHSLQIFAQMSPSQWAVFWPPRLTPKLPPTAPFPLPCSPRFTTT